MTYKEKLERLRAEIVRRMDELYDKLPDGNQVINGAVTAPDANITGKYTALESILSFVDSMQGRSKDRCIGCNNVKGCVTCVDGSEWAHYREVSCVSSRAEPEGEDLEEAAKHYLYSNILYDDVYVGNPTDKDCIEMFKAGAKWIRDKMMKDAVDGLVYAQLTTSGEIMVRSNYFKSATLNYLDIVKLIIIKEDKV